MEWTIAIISVALGVTITHVIILWRWVAARPALRIWRFRLEFSKAFIERFNGSSLKLFREPLQVLNELIIEDFTYSLRIHRWMTPIDSLDSDGGPPLYDWFDEYAHMDTMRLWTFETKEMRGPLNLSLRRARDYVDKSVYELVFWFNGDFNSNEIPPKDVIFSLPLEPETLCRQYDPHSFPLVKNRKSGELSPIDEHRWTNECEESGEYLWSWHLSMQTFRR